MPYSNLICNYKTRLMPIIGYPMDHSNASQVYNKLFEIYNLNNIMFPIEIKPEDLGDFVKAAKTLHIEMYSLTMPLKAKIIPFLDHVDESSRTFHSVNIVKTVNGETYGSGMDGKGCVTALKNAGAQLEGKKAVLLGAGSISGAIIYELMQNKIGQVTLLNRTLENAQKVADIIEDNWGMHVTALETTSENLDEQVKDADIFINCSPLGMYGFGEDHSYLGFIDKMPAHCIVLDCPVNPEYTTLLKKAEARGLTIVKGMEMMISQMTEIYDFCFGLRPGDKEKEECRKVLVAYLDSLKK